MVDLSQISDVNQIYPTISGIYENNEINPHNLDVSKNNQDESSGNDSKNKPARPWLFPPGKSGNPGGRPSGIKNMPDLGGPLTNEILANLENLSKAQLINIIKRVGGAIWGVGIMTDDEAYEAVRLKLLHTGLTSESANSSLNVLKEWIDRTKGKAVQRIDQKIEHAVKAEPAEMTNDQLLALISKAGSAGMLPAGVKLEGGKVITDAEYENI